MLPNWFDGLAERCPIQFSQGAGHGIEDFQAYHAHDDLIDGDSAALPGITQYCVVRMSGYLPERPLQYAYMEYVFEALVIPGRDEWQLDQFGVK